MRTSTEGSFHQKCHRFETDRRILLTYSTKIAPNRVSFAFHLMTRIPYLTSFFGSVQPHSFGLFCHCRNNANLHCTINHFQWQGFINALVQFHFEYTLRLTNEHGYKITQKKTVMWSFMALQSNIVCHIKQVTFPIVHTWILTFLVVPWTFYFLLFHADCKISVEMMDSYCFRMYFMLKESQMNSNTIYICQSIINYQYMLRINELACVCVWETVIILVNFHWF